MKALGINTEEMQYRGKKNIEVSMKFIVIIFTKFRVSRNVVITKFPLPKVLVTLSTD